MNCAPWTSFSYQIVLAVWISQSNLLGCIFLVNGCIEALRLYEVYYCLTKGSCATPKHCLCSVINKVIGPAILVCWLFALLISLGFPKRSYVQIDAHVCLVAKCYLILMNYIVGLGDKTLFGKISRISNRYLLETHLLLHSLIPPILSLVGAFGSFNTDFCLFLRCLYINFSGSNAFPSSRFPSNIWGSVMIMIKGEAKD